MLIKFIANCTTVNTLLFDYITLCNIHYLSQHSRLDFWEREINRYVTDPCDRHIGRFFFLPYIEDFNLNTNVK